MKITRNNLVESLKKIDKQIEDDILPLQALYFSIKNIK